MQIPKLLRHFAAIVCVAFVSVSAYGVTGQAIPPTKIEFTGPASEVLTAGKTHTFTASDSQISFFDAGVFAFILQGGSTGSRWDVSFDVRDVGKHNFDFIPGQKYENTIGLAVAGQPKGPYMTMSSDGKACNDDVNSKGSFEMGEYQWQRTYVPAAISSTGRDKPDSLTVTRFQVKFEFQCNGGQALQGVFDFYGEPAPLGEFLVEVRGPSTTCPDPFGFGTTIGTGTPCTGTGETPGGEEPGGGVIPSFPTFPPPPPAPDVTIGLPPVLAEAPFLQINNNSGTSFSFQTTPANSSFNSDVHLSVTSDAGEGDNFNVSISPSFIPAPGVGTATVTIAAGPNTFPRDYLVTVTALANDKTHNVSFIVNVACDPPQILGINQPRSQRVNRGSTATMQVTPSGSGPFNYQWYSGRRGNTRVPIAGATNATLTTPAVTGEQSYWVRVSNACGTVDSNSVTIGPR